MATTRERREGEREGLTQSFLWAPLRAAQALARQRELVEQLQSRCRRVTARSDGLPRSGGQGPERLWIRLADAVETEKALARALLVRRQAVERAAGRVADPAGREVLRLRYIQGLTWPEIQREVGCSESTVFRLHRRATAEVERLLWQRKSRCA